MKNPQHGARGSLTMWRDDGVGPLIRDAGPRPEPPAEDLAAIREAAETAWRDVVTTERVRRRRAASRWALAASVAMATLFGWWWVSRTAPPAPRITAASVERSSGAVTVDGTASAGAVIGAGSVVETAGADSASPGRLSLRLAGGHAARLDHGTRLTIVSADRLELESGAVYLDSGASPSAAAVEVATAYGTVREIGTQFEVRVDDAAMSVRVREGRVAWDLPAGSHSAAAGEELRLTTDGSVVRAALEPHAAAWEWVALAAPVFDIEGRELGRYLDWVCRETGRSLVWEDPELAAAARRIRLHGSIEGLTPDESLAVVLPGSALAYRLENGSLVLAAAD